MVPMTLVEDISISLILTQNLSWILYVDFFFFNMCRHQNMHVWKQDILPILSIDFF